MLSSLGISTIKSIFFFTLIIIYKPFCFEYIMFVHCFKTKTKNKLYQFHLDQLS